MKDIFQVELYIVHEYITVEKITVNSFREAEHVRNNELLYALNSGKKVRKAQIKHYKVDY